MAHRLSSLLVLSAAAVPLAAAGDYVGVLKLPASPVAIAIPDPGMYWRSAEPSLGPLGVPSLADGFQLKLGYRYSRYFSFETGYADAVSPSPFSAFGGQPARARGYSMDTVGTLPLWGHSTWGHATLYGRLGAWRSDASVSLLPGETASRPGAGVRYGLGLKYDVTRSVGLQAEMERFSPLDRWGPRESADTDQFKLGVRWRF